MSADAIKKAGSGFSSGGKTGFSRARILFYLLIAGGVTLRLIAPFIHNPIDGLWSDPGRWWEYASSGTSTYPLSLVDPVFFQAWLSFVAKFTLDLPILTALYAGALSVFTPWVWYRFFREILPSKDIAMAGWAILMWLPSWIGIYSYFMTETLLLPLLGLSLWQSFRALRKKDTGSFLWAVFLWILTALTRSIGVPIGIGIMLFVWLNTERKLQAALFSTGLVVLVLAVLGFRSFERSGAITPLGQPWLNQAYVESGKEILEVRYYSGAQPVYNYGFKSPSMDTPIFAPFSDWRSARKGKAIVAVQLNDLANSWEQQIDRITADPPDRWHLRTENLIFLFFGQSWPDNNPHYLIEAIANLMRWIWAPAFLVAIGILVKAGLRKHEYATPVLAALLLWFLFQGLLLFAVNEGRYRKPAEGLIIAALLIGVSYRRSASEDFSKD
jgi:glycosyltransferase involved in cell wall biosynthesis